METRNTRKETATKTITAAQGNKKPIYDNTMSSLRKHSLSFRKRKRPPSAASQRKNDTTAPLSATIPTAAAQEEDEKENMGSKNVNSGKAYLKKGTHHNGRNNRKRFLHYTQRRHSKNKDKRNGNDDTEPLLSGEDNSSPDSSSSSSSSSLDVDWDLLSLELSGSFAQTSTTEGESISFQDVATEDDSLPFLRRQKSSQSVQESIASRDNSIKKFVSSFNTTVSEMESFLKRNDSQANFGRSGWGSDDDDLDNELRELADAERELHDVMEGCLQRGSDNNDLSSLTGAAADDGSALFSILLNRDDASNASVDIVSDLDDSRHTLGDNIFATRQQQHHVDNVDNDSDGTSDDIIRMKVKRRLPPYLENLDHIEDTAAAAADDNNSTKRVSLSPRLTTRRHYRHVKLRSWSYTDDSLKSPISVTKLFPNLAGQQQNPTDPVSNNLHQNKKHGYGHGHSRHKRQSSDFYQLPSKLSKEQRRKLSEVISVGTVDSSTEAEGSSLSSSEKNKIHACFDGKTVTLSPSSVKMSRQTITISPTPTPRTKNLSRAPLPPLLPKDSDDDLFDALNDLSISSSDDDDASSQRSSRASKGSPLAKEGPKINYIQEKAAPQPSPPMSKPERNRSIYLLQDPQERDLKIDLLPAIVEMSSVETEQTDSTDQDEDSNTCIEETDGIVEIFANSIFSSNNQHTYKIKPFLTKNDEIEEFTRTYEGTFLVYLASCVAVGFLHASVPHSHFWITALVVPPTVTLIEINMTHKKDEATIALIILSCRLVAGKMLGD